MSTEIMFDNGNKLELRNGKLAELPKCDALGFQPQPPIKDGQFAVGSPIGWKEGGVTPVSPAGNGWTTQNNQLGINYPSVIRIYSQWESAVNNKVICIINPDGRVIRDSIDITDNDAAMAECFVEYMKTKGIEVKRGS